MTRYELNRRAIAAACRWNLQKVRNGEGCDDPLQFLSVVRDISAIILSNPGFSEEEVVDFYNYR